MKPEYEWRPIEDLEPKCNVRAVHKSRDDERAVVVGAESWCEEVGPSVRAIQIEYKEIER